ncbi:MAG: hypothetical protein ACE5G2_09120, partial [Candidatus Krumholzibacteriia bacterium]
MQRVLGIVWVRSCAFLWTVLCSTTALAAAPTTPHHELTTTFVDVDDTARGARVAKTASDTIWIADWTFDDGSPCNDAGWEKFDVFAPQDSTIYWHVGADFSGTGGISGQAAILSNHDLCWVLPDGYGNDWYQAIRISYGGRTLLSFDYLLDSEAGFDFLQVEVDSACVPPGQSSGGCVDPPCGGPVVLFADSGFDTAGNVDALPLPDFDTPADTHCVYIAFFSDDAWSPEDGLQSTTLGVAAVIDNVVLADAGDPLSPATITFSEDFEGTLNPNVSFQVRIWPFLDSAGQWARLFPHPTDTDVCTENTTCSWVFFDPGFQCRDSEFLPPCVRPWIDNVIVSPWVSLASTAGASGTVLSFREFPGQPWSRITRSWSVRGKLRIENTDTPAPGDSVDCPTPWGHTSSWASLGDLTWLTRIHDVETEFDPASVEIQVRFRVSDWLWIVPTEPPFISGPGPFIDRVRIGRRFLDGPVISEGIDSRTQAQDAFPTEIHPLVPPVLGEHHRPTTDRFGTAAFSRGDNLGRMSPVLITGDSISVEVVDARGAGGITSVEWYGAIVAGPHAGKAPPPWTVGANGFFVVPADSARDPSGSVVENHWFVDLDDDYFRGGDALRYFWLATDAEGGVTSDPEGLAGAPASVDAAQAATGGLLEVNVLPAIDWDPAYLARVAADPHGKLEPTPEELANSTQANCLLYAQMVNPRRRSGLAACSTSSGAECGAHRTSFMHTLATLGYHGHFDVYDVQGYGNTNNQLAGRATVEQATGYSLLVYDAGNARPGSPIMPDGSDLDTELIDQATWFRSWLAQAAASQAGSATLWILGSDVVQEKPANALYTASMGVVFVSGNQGLNSNPDVAGQAPMTFSNGNTADFAGDSYSLNGGCPTIRSYDALASSGAAVETHNYRDPASGALGGAAFVMNSNPAEDWNTILQSHAWSDIRDPMSGPSSPTPEALLMQKILGSVLLAACQQTPDPPSIARSMVRGR